MREQLSLSLGLDFLTCNVKWLLRFLLVLSFSINSSVTPTVLSLLKTPGVGAGPLAELMVTWAMGLGRERTFPWHLHYVF